MDSSVIYFTSAAFWTFILLAFGLGYLTANIFTRNKYSQQLDKCQLEKSMLLNNVRNEEARIVEESGVKAVQTRGRSGIPVMTGVMGSARSKKKDNSLDFERIGPADMEQKDDLQRIDGIGPFIEKQLNEIGICHYIQISRFNENDIRIITEELEFFPGRIVRDKWIEQAIALYKSELKVKSV